MLSVSMFTSMCFGVGVCRSAHTCPSAVMVRPTSDVCFGLCAGVLIGVAAKEARTGEAVGPVRMELSPRQVPGSRPRAQGSG